VADTIGVSFRIITPKETKALWPLIDLTPGSPRPARCAQNEAEGGRIRPALWLQANQLVPGAALT